MFSTALVPHVQQSTSKNNNNPHFDVSTMLRYDPVTGHLINYTQNSIDVSPRNTNFSTRFNTCPHYQTIARLICTKMMSIKQPKLHVVYEIFKAKRLLKYKLQFSTTEVYYPRSRCLSGKTGISENVKNVGLGSPRR